MPSTRRKLLTSSAAGAAALAAPAFLRAQDPAKRYRTALIGTGWWGMNILNEALASGACTCTALCDVDRRFLDKAAEGVEKKSGDAPRRYPDFREMLEKEKPEIVIVGTPDHWHALQTIAAVKAGAHVYVEKPISHTILEGRAMVKAARDAGRVVQVGTHRRVSPHNVSAREFIRAGKLGTIGMVRAFVHYGGGPETPRKNVEPPAELDWDLWCGPAPVRPYNGDGGIHPRGFRQYLDYANGTLGDWGIHWMDQILWMLDAQAPKTVFSTGGRPVKGPPVLTKEEQTSDAPDHQVAAFEFDGFTATWEHRAFAANHAEKGENVGCYFYGTAGTLHVGWQKGWVFYPADGKKPVVEEPARLNPPDGQNIRELWADFLDAIRTGRKPICDIEAIHRSTTLSLLGMLSMKVGRSLRWDEEKHVCVGDPEATGLLRRAYRAPWVYPEA